MHFSHFVPLLAVPAVLLAPHLARPITPYLPWILGLLLFFSFLGMRLRGVLQAIHQPFRLLYVNLILLVAGAFVIYPVMQGLVPEYLLGAVIFMLLPAAVSSPAVAAIYGGNVSFAAVTAVISNLLCPFTITAFFALILNTQVDFDLRAMFLKLLLIVFIPFVLVLGVDKFFPHMVENTRHHYRPINLGLLFLLFFAALGPYDQAILTHLADLRLWLAIVITHAVLYGLAKLGTWHIHDKKEVLAIESNLLFLNTGLGIVIAQNYFGPNEVLFMVFVQIAWMLLLAGFKYLR